MKLKEERIKLLLEAGKRMNKDYTSTLIENYKIH